MRVLNDFKRKVAKTRQATKLFGRDMKARLRNQFTKRNMGTYDQDIAHQKTLAQLAYEQPDKIRSSVAWYRISVGSKHE